MRKGTLPLVLLAMLNCADAQDLATEVEAEEISPGIYMIVGVGGFSSNMAALVGDDHVLLIDNGMAPITASLVQTVEKLAGRPIDYVINTHMHGDHIGSNATLANNGATIVAHDNLRSRLAENPEPAGGIAGLPVITFDHAMTFHLNDQHTVAYHFESAHTDGDAVIHFPDANVIDAGDLFFNYMFPFIDLNSGGSVDGYIAGQQRIIEMADENTMIIPGHGPLARQSDLQVAVDMLADARSRVQTLIDDGLSQEDAVAANPLAGYRDQWDWGFINGDKLTATIYRALTTQ